MQDEPGVGGIAKGQSRARAVSRDPPCSFCGVAKSTVHVGFRAMICDECIEQMRQVVAQLDGSNASEPVHHSVAGSECVFCGRILSTAAFSVRRWIFGICDTCACSMTKSNAQYAGTPSQSFEF
jgi:hypothetical protein